MRMLRRLIIGIVAIALAIGVADLVAVATINSAANKTIALGNGSTTQFTFSFVGDQPGYISVIYTDTFGNETTLVQGSGPTQYQLTLNAAVSPGLWGIGGMVTYDPSGTPIAPGTSLTIIRALPYVQNISLLNLASLAAVSQAAETGLDQLEMQIQQISENINRVVAGPVSDPTGINYTLPPVAQRANLAVCNDSMGNIIACAVPATGIISAAMQPVVDASTLAAGRAALGLGSMATGSANYGLQSGVSCAGCVDANNTPVQDATSQAVVASFHDTQRICTGPITYTLPRANTLWAGFGFWVYAVSSTCTITPNAADNFLGVASGTGIAVTAGSWVYVTTSAASSGVWWADYHGATAPNIVAGAVGGAVTFTVYSGPLEFRDTTLANGDPVWSLPARGIALTIPSSATLGSTNNTPYRVYLFVAYNNGTPLLGAATCSSPTAFYGCPAWENQRITAAAIGAGSTAPGTLYTSGAISTDSVIIIGYADFCVTASCTAGTWTAPTTVVNCLAPRQCRKPGDMVKMAAPNLSAINAVALTSATATNITASITPTSTINLIKYTMISTIGVPNATSYVNATYQMYRNTTALGAPTPFAATMSGASAGVGVPANLINYDSPQSTSSVTYTIKGTTSAGANDAIMPFNDGGAGNPAPASLLLEEIQGELEPANENFPVLSKAA